MGLATGDLKSLVKNTWRAWSTARLAAPPSQH